MTGGVVSVVGTVLFVPVSTEPLVVVVLPLPEELVSASVRIEGTPTVLVKFALLVDEI
jgi:hypothetical protein